VLATGGYSIMHILLFALGSSGDVHPVLGLATALRARGHRATVATNPHFQPLVERLNLPFVPIGTAEEFRAAMENPDLWDPKKGFDFVVDRLIVPYITVIYNIIAANFVPGETVVVAPPTAMGARIANAKLGVPLATMHLAPALIRSMHESPVLPLMLVGRGIPRWFKRLQYWLIDRIIDSKLGGPLNAILAEHGLPPARGIMNEWWNSPQLALCLFPEWFGPPQPDWLPQCVLTGFPLWDEQEVLGLPPQVDAFLQNGDPPIVFTPGSAMLHGHEFFIAAIDACRRLNRRGILLTRFPEQLPSTLPPEIAHFDFIPFSQVLPRAASVVHHAGVGSSAQGLAAGVPQVLMPMAHDQFDNAERLRRLGVGEAIPLKRFRGDVLAATLSRLINSAPVQERCRYYASLFDTAGDLDKSCRAIESLLTPSLSRTSS
jgi:rhamnosyltransferase subunit B